VKWNIAFIGFCLYSVAVITYLAPIGQAAMILALLGLIFGADRIRWPAPLICFAAYYFWAAATYPASPWAPVVKHELVLIGRVALIFLVAVNVLTERSRLRFYVFLTLAAYGFYPVRGAVFNQFIYHAGLQGRIAWNGMFANPNDLAALLMFPLGLAAGYIYAEKQKYFRVAAFVGTAVISLIVFMTQSRGAILSLAFFGLWTLARQKRRLRMLPALVAVGVVVAIFAPSGVWTRMKKITSATTAGELKEAGDQGSAEQRFEIWKVGIRISGDYPITGVGLGAYSYEHWKYARSVQEGFKRTAQGKRDAHSSYITALVETGVVGFVFWIGIFVTTFRTVLCARRAAKVSDPDGERQLFFAQLGMMAFGVAGIFGSWTGTPHTYMDVAILYSLSVIALEKHRERSMLPQVARV
jgi:O-antigen ligase